jgi:hypothetical protein
LSSRAKNAAQNDGLMILKTIAALLLFKQPCDWAKAYLRQMFMLFKVFMYLK